MNNNSSEDAETVDDIIDDVATEIKKSLARDVEISLEGTTKITALAYCTKAEHPYRDTSPYHGSSYHKRAAIITNAIENASKERELIPTAGMGFRFHGPYSDMASLSQDYPELAEELRTVIGNAELGHGLVYVVYSKTGALAEFFEKEEIVHITKTVPKGETTTIRAYIAREHGLLK